MRKKRKHYTNITQSTKMKVWERDERNCIYCKGRREEYISPIVNGVRKMSKGIYNPHPNAHYIARSQGGLGIEQNIVTLCMLCHHDFDNGNNTERREDIKNTIEEHLQFHYDDWNKEDLIYKKEDYL